MKLSTRARYALRAMIVFAREAEGSAPLNLAEVANRTAISYRYLEQVAISLKNAGLLKAVSGKHGGHLLARSAQEIKLGEIVEAAIGPINIVECVRHPEYCMKVDCCECRSVYCLINERIMEALNAFSLADLAENRAGKMVTKELSPA